MTQPRESNRYAVRRKPEPFDVFDRWEVVELDYYMLLPDRARHVSSHLTRRKALKCLRRLQWNQAHPATVTAERIPLADLRTQ